VTVLAYHRGRNFELIVCGSPSAAWVEWVRTTTVPLTAGQWGWRQTAQARVDKLAQVASYPRKVETPEACVHRDNCDRCGFCETCTCECHELGGAG
jgi:predicted RecB family nuclease